MRRMITEKDVEKLGKITEADIESVQAMQSPIGATANYVLTADGAGKAQYKAPASGGTTILQSTTSVDGDIKQNPKYGYYVEKKDTFRPKIISCRFYNQEIKSGDTIIPYSDVILMAITYSSYTSILILIPETTMTKHNLTVGSQITSNVGYYYYKN